MQLKFFLAALVVFVSGVNAVELFSASNHVDMYSNTNGQLTLWFASQSNASFAVNSQGQVSTTVSPSFGVIGAGAVKSIVVTFSMPLCSQGSFYETINLDLTTSGFTQRVSKVVEVNVQRSASNCDSTVTSFPQSLQVSEAANSISLSSISLDNSFKPSEVNVAIYSQDGRGDIANGETVSIPVTIVNRGSPGSFTVSLVAVPQLNAVLSGYSFNLHTSEAKQLQLTASPQDIEGRQWVSVQVLKGGQVIAVKDIYFDVANNHKLVLEMPQVVKITNCGVVTLAGKAINKGSAPEKASVSLPFLNAVSNEISIAPRSSTSFVLNLDASSLAAGLRLVELVLLSSEAASSKQVVQLQVEQCSAGLLNYSVDVTNTGNETLAGVSVAVSDIPPQWDVLTQYPVDIAPGETKKLPVLLRQNGQWSEDVVPMLVVKDAKGREVKSEKLQTVKANAASSTGLFLAGLGGLTGLQWIAAIVFVALMIALMSARVAVRRSSA